MLIVLLALVCRQSVAQTYDTLTPRDGRLPGYHYTTWYDTCRWYCEPFSYRDHTEWPVYRQRWKCDYYYRGDYYSDQIMFQAEIPSRPIAVVGVGVWQVDTRVAPDFSYLNHEIVLDTSRLPEYVFLVQRDEEKDSTYFLDSVRWDTAAAKVLRLPVSCDTLEHGYRNFWLHEARFSKPIVLDSIFYLGGTKYNNELLGTGVYKHRPTAYGYIMNFAWGQNACHWDNRIDCLYTPYNDRWIKCVRSLDPTWGKYMPMVDYANVSVTPADSSMGTAGPNERLSMHIDQEIYARAYPGYRFSHWNDGDTRNPRPVFLMQDTAFVAYFTVNETCEVIVVSNDEAKGDVSGGGTFWIGDSVIIKAIPFEPYVFSRWNDGDTANPRQILAEGDTMFTAVFSSVESVGSVGQVQFSISPNPASKYVVIECGQYASANVSFYDVSGHEVLSAQLTSPATKVNVASLPAGMYYVTLTSPQGVGSRKLVVK